MHLQRILSLALVACAAVSASALDFSDTGNKSSTTATRDGDDNEGSVPNDEQRIYGGSEADIGKYPWTVSLRKTADGRTFCGGTLVASQYIVTAAHCVLDTVYASIGSQFAQGTKGGERIRVTNQWVHPKYNKETHAFDVAVMKLEKPSMYKTLPLCKADGSDNKENTMTVVRGWGITESKSAASSLLEVNVKIISNAVCSKSYNNRITEQMICAGQGGGKDTCQGDSGGALIANNALVGIVSWGGACGEAPGVYVRVTTVLDFINEKISGGNRENGNNNVDNGNNNNNNKGNGNNNNNNKGNGNNNKGNGNNNEGNGNGNGNNQDNGSNGMSTTDDSSGPIRDTNSNGDSTGPIRDTNSNGGPSGRGQSWKRGKRSNTDASNADASNADAERGTKPKKDCRARL